MCHWFPHRRKYFKTLFYKSHTSAMNNFFLPLIQLSLQLLADTVLSTSLYVTCTLVTFGAFVYPLARSMKPYVTGNIMLNAQYSFSSSIHSSCPFNKSNMFSHNHESLYKHFIQFSEIDAFCSTTAIIELTARILQVSILPCAFILRAAFIGRLHLTLYRRYVQTHAIKCFYVSKWKQGSF